MYSYSVRLQTAFLRSHEHQSQFDRVLDHIRRRTESLARSSEFQFSVAITPQILSGTVCLCETAQSGYCLNRESAEEKNLFVLSLFQTYVEAIYLNNDEVLGLQTSEDHHIFQWLKFQASRGTTEAEVGMSL